MGIRKHALKFIAALGLLLFLSPAGFTVDAPQFIGSGHIRYMIETGVRNPYQLRVLSRWLERSGFDVAGMNWRQGQIEVVTDSQGVHLLALKGLHGLPLRQIRPGESQGPDSHYLNPERLTQKLQAIAKAYPSLTRLEQIGTSLQGRPIWALLISDTPQAGDPRSLEKPSIIFDALHHAREVMTPEIVMDVAQVMLTGVESSRRIQSLLHTWNIWLVPMVNVDGANIVFTKDNMWRKNARGDSQNIYGVDINRNYPYRWNGCGGSSDNTAADDYHGPAEASEPETVAMMKLGNEVRPAASLSYHSYSEFVLFPYGCHGSLTPEDQMVERLAKNMAALLPSDSGDGTYTPGAPWQLLYDVDGDSMDYMYAAYGALAYTFEINQDFQPDYSLRNPTVLKHRKAWAYFMNFIDQNLLTTVVIDGHTQKPATALVAIDTIAHNQGELPFKTNGAGRFFKVLDPGHYVVGVQLQDGRTAQAAVQMEGKPQTVTITVP